MADLVIRLENVGGTDGLSTSGPEQAAEEAAAAAAEAANAAGMSFERSTVAWEWNTFPGGR